MFIVIEGTDCCGKTTQCTKLASRLCGVGKVVRTLKFPMRDTSTGQLIDAFLKGEIELNPQSVQLLFSANRWEFAEEIRELLKQKVVVVADRYTYSALAYSAIHDLDPKWCAGLDAGLPVPDMVIMLNMPVSTSHKRGKFGSERYEDPAMQEIVRANFQQMFPREDVDADRSMDDVAASIWDLVSKALKM